MGDPAVKDAEKSFTPKRRKSVEDGDQNPGLVGLQYLEDHPRTDVSS